jgi:regulation of enolase protein 1 (concanavalin A-like superfamily)
MTMPDQNIKNDAHPHSLLNGSWLNEPKIHSAPTTNSLHLETDNATDFWRETHYGFTHDSGHFLGVEAPPSFTCQLRIRGNFEALYDQAGLMVRINERQWVKAGIELSDGQAMLGSVLTDGQSDWATSPYIADPAISGCAPRLPTAYCACRFPPMDFVGRWCAYARFPSHRPTASARWRAAPSAAA